MPLYSRRSADESDVKYMFYLRSRVEVNNGCTGWRQVNLVKQDDLETIYVDPFNRPSSSNPIIYFEDNSVFIVCGDGSAESLMITFIKKLDQNKYFHIGHIGISQDAGKQNNLQIILVKNIIYRLYDQKVMMA